MEEITVTLRYTPEDYSRIAPVAKQIQTSYKYWMAIFPLGVFLAIIGMIYAMSYQGDKLNYFAIFLFSAIPAVFLFFAIFLLQKFSPKISGMDKISPSVTKYNLSKQLDSKPAPAGEMTLTFSDKGINCSNDLFSEDLEWKSFNKAIESETDIFLFTPLKYPQFIPKHAFDDFQMKRIRELIKMKLGEKAEFNRWLSG